MQPFRFPKASVAFLFFILSFIFTVSCDQTGTTTTFSGTVADAVTNRSLPGVSVSVMPFNLGEETDEEGKFSISLPRTDESVYLVFSKPGYDSQETLKMPLSPRKKNLYTFHITLIRRVALPVLSENLVDFEGKKTEVSLELSNTGNDTLSWNFLDIYFPEWLAVEPVGGILPPEGKQNLLFLCDRTGLGIGSYNEEIQLVGGEEPLTIPILMKVEGALLKANKTSFDFGEEETDSSTTLSNEGNLPLTWHLKEELPGWLAWQITEGSLDGGEEVKVKITADRSELEFGDHSFTTELLSDGGDITYVFQISKTRNLIQVSVQSIDFGSESTQSKFTVKRLSGVFPVPFTISCEDENLTLSLLEGVITKENEQIEVLVELDRENIATGASQSAIRVVAPEQDFTLLVNYSTAAVVPEVSTDGYGPGDEFRLCFKGTLISNGGGSVVQHGHCWSITPQPEVIETTGTEQAGCTRLGALEEGRPFVSYPEPLPDYGTTWYVRTYAENEVGISYGETFVLEYAPPIVKSPYISYDDYSNTLVLRERNATGMPYIEHGFVWNTTGELPVLGTSHSVFMGEKTEGSMFTHNLSNPERNKEYTMQSFAVNAFGLVYSGPVSYFLHIEEPVLETREAEDVTYYTATLEGSLERKGSEAILSYGHCWSIDSEPTLEDSYSNLGAQPRVGNFSSFAEGLLINTTYYYRAYVKTVHGVYYGATKELTTLHDASVVVQEGLKMFITVSEEGKAYDWTGATHDLIVSNGITYQYNNKPGGVRAAISFNGSSGYLYSKNFNPLSGVSKGSMNFWLRFRTHMNKNVKYPFFGSVSEDGFFVLIDHDGKDWRMTLCMGPGQETHVVSLPALGTIDISTFLGKEWHMLSIVSDGASMSVFFDGMNMYTANMQMTFGVQNDLVIGGHAHNGTVLNTFIPADMVALRFYDRMLSESEVLRIFNAEK